MPRSRPGSGRLLGLRLSLRNPAFLLRLSLGLIFWPLRAACGETAVVERWIVSMGTVLELRVGALDRPAALAASEEALREIERVERLLDLEEGRASGSVEPGAPAGVRRSGSGDRRLAGRGRSLVPPHGGRLRPYRSAARANLGSARRGPDSERGRTAARPRGHRLAAILVRPGTRCGASGFRERASTRAPGERAMRSMPPRAR